MVYILQLIEIQRYRFTADLISKTRYNSTARRHDSAFALCPLSTIFYHTMPIYSAASRKKCTIGLRNCSRTWLVGTNSVSTIDISGSLELDRQPESRTGSTNTRKHSDSGAYLSGKDIKSHLYFAKMTCRPTVQLVAPTYRSINSAFSTVGLVCKNLGLRLLKSLKIFENLWKSLKISKV